MDARGAGLPSLGRRVFYTQTIPVQRIPLTARGCKHTKGHETKAAQTFICLELPSGGSCATVEPLAFQRVVFSAGCVHLGELQDERKRRCASWKSWFKRDWQHDRVQPFSLVCSSRRLLILDGRGESKLRLPASSLHKRGSDDRDSDRRRSRLFSAHFTTLIWQVRSGGQCSD